MGFDYFVFYTEASLVCVIILTMILITDRGDIYTDISG